MPCGVCGGTGHNARSCVHDAPRVAISGGRKSKRCECCGLYGYDVQRHHTRGRGDDSDYLDVCCDCHLTCCHGGNFRNIGKKPRVCRIVDRTAYWCG
jgi:hypothetical protein